MTYPAIRMRRLRKTPRIRDLVAETHLRITDLVYPVFISDQRHVRIPVPSMPGIHQLSIDNALIEIGQAMETGLRAMMIFGVPDEKDNEGTPAYAEDGVVQRAVRKIKSNFGDDLLVITDTCLCEYMSHGHCGIVMGGRVLNDPSAEIIARVAVSQAEAGADMVAPSDMMDGRILYVREALDDAGLEDVPILAYSAKYASGFYAPFRDAANAAPTFGDRKTYQMDPRNGREALEEVTLDAIEGADMVMVKPALAYLDIIHQIRGSINLPVAAYNVSGEYAMVKAAAEKGWLDEKTTVMEILTGIKRAGADIIVTYHAPDAARWIKEAG